jgi:parallel beta-helix repeat protein
VVAADPLPLSRVLLVLAIAGALIVGFGWLTIGPDHPMFGGLLGQPRFSPAPALTLQPPSESGRDLIVDGTGGGHFWTITAALAAAVDGDRIILKPGVYAESVVIAKDVEIVGEGGPERVVMKPFPSDAEGSAAFAAAIEGLSRPLRDGYDILGLRDERGEGIPADLLGSGWRFVLYLDHADASISGITIEGSEIGTAILIEGGAPILASLVVDNEGEILQKSGTDPHESVMWAGAATGTLRDSIIRDSWVTVGDGSTPTIQANSFPGSCLGIGGSGSDAAIEGNHFESSECPYYHVWVFDGAAPTIVSNDIIGDRHTDGIRVTGAGSSPTIEGNDVAGAYSGIWIGDDAAGLVQRNNVTGARIGISIVGANPMVSANTFIENDTGVMVDGDGTPTFMANAVCRNGMDVDLRGADVFPEAANGGAPCEGGDGS